MSNLQSPDHSSQLQSPHHSSQRATVLHLTLGGAQHGVLFFLIPTLVGLLQIKYQAAKESPFYTHKPLMSAFIVVVILYTALLLLQIRLEAHGAVCLASINNVTLLVGALAGILLLLVLVPFVGWTFLPLWFPCFITAVHRLYQEFREELCQGLLCVNDGILALWKKDRNRLPQ